MKKIMFFCLSLIVLSVNAWGQSLDRWIGLWTWDDEEHATTYELLISSDENNSLKAELTSECAYYSYKIEGPVIVKSDRIEVYYAKTVEKRAWAIELSTPEFPIITLKQKKDEIITFWHQDFRDFFDNPMGETVCFEKE